MGGIYKKIIQMTVFVSLSMSAAAHAALGRSEASIETDRTSLNATHTRTLTSKFTAHQLVGQMNTVTEYADSSGFVFAVTWHGIVKPDLTTLLGSYFQEYNDSDSLRSRMFTRQPIRIQTGNLIVTKEGHMRDVRGRAYLPSRLPAGVNLWRNWNKSTRHRFRICCLTAGCARAFTASSTIQPLSV